MKEVPFWVDDHPRPDGLTSELPDETDYLIVGSGLTGLSAAHRLATSGAAVTVVDAGEIAGGASSINGGMVSPDVKAGMRAVLDSYGPEIAKEMWASTVRSIGLVREIGARVGAVTHEGGLAGLGRGPRAFREVSRTVEWYRARFGVSWEVVEARDIGSIFGGGQFDVALYEPEGFGVHPARLVFGLARDAARAGARLVDRCRATDIEKLVSGFAVTTSRGAVQTGDVILATNGYTTREPSDTLARLVVPVGSYIIATEPLGEERANEIFPGGAMAYTNKRLLNYMRRTHDDRIILGGRRNLRPGLDLNESARALRESLVAFWPKLEDAEITHVWGGRVAVPFDLTPHMGRVDGAWYAMGYAGHGVGLSTQLGHELAGMLLGEDPPSVYSRIPHQGRFYYSGGRSPWFLSPASYLYRVLDKLGV